MKLSFFHKAILLAACSAALVMFLMLIGLLKFYRIPTAGMSPTVKPGDLVLSTRSFSASSSYKRGQIVIFRPPISPHNRFIQRIVALPGDHIEVIDGSLAVNGVVLRSPEGFLAKRPTPNHRVPGLRMPDYPMIVPEGRMFLIGDNYSNSLDSRYFGPVEVKEITHLPRMITFPPNRAGRLK